MGKIMDGKAASLTDISSEFTMEEIAVVAKILARFSDVSVTERDAQEYVDVIRQEYEKKNVGNPALAEPQEDVYKRQRCAFL